MYNNTNNKMENKNTIEGNLMTEARRRRSIVELHIKTVNGWTSLVNEKPFTMSCIRGVLNQHFPLNCTSTHTYTIITKHTTF